jgi:hypothetical protein
MKKLVFFILLVSVTTVFWAEVNGFVTQIEDKKIIKVWGTHSERGYAQGYLLAEGIMEVFDDYMIGQMLYGQASAYNSLRTFFEGYFTVEDKYLEEAEGVIQGIAAAGISIESEFLNRDIDATDILICNSVPDLSTANAALFSPDFQGGCSSFTSWGESTQETELNGSLVITRYLDWSSSPILHDNSIMIIHEPSEEDEQPWLSFGFAGFFAALSGINSSGVAVFQNMGYADGRTLDHTFQPINLTTRSAIEKLDYNNDGSSNIFDVQSALNDNGSFFGAIIQAATFATEETPAAVFEINDELGLETRLVSDNTQIVGNNLAATNHMRKLVTGEYCIRYECLVNALNDDPQISMESNWDIMENACSVAHNVHAIQYNPASGTVRWASTNSEEIACEQTPTTFNLDDLLNLVVDNEDEVVEYKQNVNIYPNPFNPTTNIAFSLTNASDVSVDFFDVKGRKVDSILSMNYPSGENLVQWNADHLSSGVYFAKINIDNRTQISKKIVLLK